MFFFHSGVFDCEKNIYGSILKEVRFFQYIEVLQSCYVMYQKIHKKKTFIFLLVAFLTLLKFKIAKYIYRICGDLFTVCLFIFDCILNYSVFFAHFILHYIVHNT